MTNECSDITVCGQRLCTQCDYHKGTIVDAAKRLLEFVEKYQSLGLIVKTSTDYDYEQFTKLTQWLASQDKPCKGCRQGGGWSWWPDCPVRDCCLSKGLDFCFQCDEFPCNKLLEGPLIERRKRIIRVNEQIKSLGMDEWLKRLHEFYRKQ
ncbi:MAG: DUF3795 domain-containing protein [Candidatus Thorarchaeota archaeon]|nr:DUF3795 domain-containing protein [Candidatus Thorarchaeota archaeon]